ncbi:MAG: dihydroorotase [Gammaproteobacteria bacterium]
MKHSTTPLKTDTLLPNPNALPRIRLRDVTPIDPAGQLAPKAQDWFIIDGQLHRAYAGPVDIDLPLTGCWLLPGMMDLSHHIREPGFKSKGSLENETRAAAASGFTRIVCPPTTDPINDSPTVTRWLIESSTRSGHVDLLPVGAMTQGLAGTQLSEMAALKDAGCVAVTHAAAPITHHRTLLRCYEYAANLGLTILSRPEDPDLAADRYAHAGAYASHLGIPAIPAASEALAVARDCILAEHTGATIHFSQISSAAALKWIIRAREEGLPITCDVAISNLLYTDETLIGFNSLYHTQPPLRSEHDRQALLEAIAHHHIQAISSHHQPHDLAAKMSPFSSSEPGMATLDSFVADLLHLVESKALTVEDMVRSVTVGPAQCLGLTSTTLTENDPANCMVIDPQHRWLLNETSSHSHGHNCPHWHQALTGANLLTVKAGAMTYLAPHLRH